LAVENLREPYYTLGIVMLATAIHIVAGLIALACGAIALSSAKGGKIHRKSGTIFVYSMMIMALTGAIMAALKPDRGSVIAGALALYLVSTSFMTVRTTVNDARWLLVSLMSAGFGIGVAGVYLGLQALQQPNGLLDGNPAGVFVVFGLVALIASLLDGRLLLSGGILGAHRIARHLWRMGFALFLATASFFLGQARLFPEPLRIPALLSLPVLLVLVLTLYWLIHVLLRKREA